jgi:hypothetical protein
MDGMEFFSTGLRAVALNLPPVSEGVCGLHNRPATLYNVGGTLMCRGCILLRQAYPVRLKSTKEGKTRLGLGCYLLITADATHYWGKHLMPDGIKVHAATGALRELVRDLLLNPPEPPWMFVAFARSNNSERLRVTTTNDLMYFSGKFAFPGTMDEPFVERLNRKRVMELRDAADLTKDEWEKVVRSHATLYASSESLAYLQDCYREHPRLAKYPIPSAKTPEYNALRLLAKGQ